MALVTTLESARLITTLDVNDSLSTGIQNATVTALVTLGSSIVTEMMGQRGIQGIAGRDGTISGVNIDGGNAASRFGGTINIDGGRA